MKVRNKIFIVAIIALVVPFGSSECVEVFDSIRWTEPVPISEINSSYHDEAPFLSFDGLTLYFARENGYTTIYKAIRPQPSEAFTMVEQISTLNYSGHVSYAWVSPDNLRMYYYRTEGSERRLKFTERTSISESWQPGTNIVELNALGNVANPSLTEDELTIVFTGIDVPGGLGGFDIWMATRPNRSSSFSNIINLKEINSSAWDFHPSISSNGLTLHFSSRRTGRSQLFKAIRASLDAPFSPPEHLSFFDSPGSYLEYPFLRSDGRALYFARRTSEKPFDIYVSYLLDVSITKTYHVNLNTGNDLNNGLSPQEAFATVQKGIDAAQDADKVLVYPGIYTESINFSGKAITLQSAADAAVLKSPYNFAVSFYSGEGSDSILKNFVIRNSLIGIFISGSSPTISNLTIVGNKSGIESYAGSQPHINNCIFWNNTYSDLLDCQATYSCIERGDEGEGNINANPLFADLNEGDYHLSSKRGRYWPEHDIWVLDKVTSSCIDSGDPSSDYSNEPIPNGGRINMGAYGGTAYASMSESPVTGAVLPPEVVAQVHGITGGFHNEDSTWFIAQFYNDSDYTITQVTIKIRLTDNMTGEHQWYDVMLGPPGSVILAGETVILSGDVGVTRRNKGFYWEVIRMIGYKN
jgi:Tol biopolymer transport system component